MVDETPAQTIARLEAELAAAKGPAMAASAAGVAPAPTAPVPSVLVVGQIVTKDVDTEHEAYGIVLALVASAPNETPAGTFTEPGARVGWFASDSTLPESLLTAG